MFKKIILHKFINFSFIKGSRNLLIPFEKKYLSQKNVDGEKPLKQEAQDKKRANQSNKPVADSGKETVEKVNNTEEKKIDKEDPIAKKEDNSKGLSDDGKSDEHKYKKLLMGLNNDWEKISVVNSQKYSKNLSDELTNGQKEYIDVLAKKYVDFNFLQIKYFHNELKERLTNLHSISIMSINENWKTFTDKRSFSLKIVTFPLQKEEKAEFPLEKEALDQLKKWMGADINASQTSVSEKSSTQQSSKNQKEEKKEEKKEKEVYDIELTSFEPSKKIVLIKEVKGLLNLGLKEAKELVEKAPTVIMKSVKKDKTEAIMTKLKENGGILKLL